MQYDSEKKRMTDGLVSLVNDDVPLVLLKVTFIATSSIV